MHAEVFSVIFPVGYLRWNPPCGTTEVTWTEAGVDEESTFSAGCYEDSLFRSVLEMDDVCAQLRAGGVRPGIDTSLGLSVAACESSTCVSVVKMNDGSHRYGARSPWLASGQGKGKVVMHDEVLSRAMVIWMAVFISTTITTTLATLGLQTGIASAVWLGYYDISLFHP